MVFHGKWYDEVKVGDSFGGSLTVTETHLVLGAGMFGDFNPLHVDEEFSKKSHVRRPHPARAVHQRAGVGAGRHVLRRHRDRLPPSSPTPAPAIARRRPLAVQALEKGLERLHRERRVRAGRHASTADPALSEAIVVGELAAVLEARDVRRRIDAPRRGRAEVRVGARGEGRDVDPISSSR